MLLPITLGLLGFIDFYFFEKYVPVEPCIPVRIFENNNSVPAYLGVVIINMILLSLMFYVPLYYKAVKEFDGIATGIVMYPQAFSIDTSTLISNVIVGRVQRFRW